MAPIGAVPDAGRLGLAVLTTSAKPATAIAIDWAAVRDRSFGAIATALVAHSWAAVALPRVLLEDGQTVARLEEVRFRFECLVISLASGVEVPLGQISRADAGQGERGLRGCRRGRFLPVPAPSPTPRGEGVRSRSGRASPTVHVPEGMAPSRSSAALSARPSASIVAAIWFSSVRFRQLVGGESPASSGTRLVSSAFHLASGSDLD